MQLKYNFFLLLYTYIIKKFDQFYMYRKRFFFFQDTFFQQSEEKKN